MGMLHRLPGSRREVSGFEWTLFRKLPRIALLGTLLPALAALAMRWLPLEGTGEALEKQLQMADILAISVIVMHWTAVFTLAIGCIIVILMKGHAYVADSYALDDAERPDPD